MHVLQPPTWSSDSKAGGGGSKKALPEERPQLGNKMLENDIVVINRSRRHIVCGNL